MILLRRTTHLAAVLALAAAATSTVDPAAAHPPAAHPLGAPQTVELVAEGHQVKIRWGAAVDDLTALALHFGLLPASRTFIYEGGVLVPGESDDSDAALLAGASEFSRYLLEHISVGQVGEPCPGRVTSSQGLTETGTADLVFTCPGEVGAVVVAVSTLTDLHPAYRTLASGGGRRETYTVDSRIHRWSLGAGANARTRLHPPFGALGFVALAAGATTYVGIRRRRAAKRGAAR